MARNISADRENQGIYDIIYQAQHPDTGESGRRNWIPRCASCGASIQNGECIECGKTVIG